MGIEIVGMVGTREASEIKGPLVDGPVVDWSEGSVIEPGYLRAIAEAHEAAGFDRVLIGYGAVAPEGFSIAGAVLQWTSALKVLIAHRPGFVQPSVLARAAATLDHLSGGGRVALHFITGGDEADQRREGDRVPHDVRYRRTGELMALLRRLFSEDAPFDFRGEFYEGDAMFTSVKPVAPDSIPFWFGGASAPAIEVGASLADVYAFWGEPREAAAARKAVIDAAAASVSRSLRYSISFRPIIAPTEEAAWDKAQAFAKTTAERIALARERSAPARETYAGLGGAAHATYSVDRDLKGTTSEGRKRLIAMSSEKEVCDERLFMKIANLTGAAGNSTALVGTPEQVADAMLSYVALGFSKFILKGFDPLDDTVDYGRELIPLLREKTADTVDQGSGSAR